MNKQHGKDLKSLNHEIYRAGRSSIAGEPGKGTNTQHTARAMQDQTVKALTGASCMSSLSTVSFPHALYTSVFTLWSCLPSWPTVSLECSREAICKLLAATLAVQGFLKASSSDWYWHSQRSPEIFDTYYNLDHKCSLKAHVLGACSSGWCCWEVVEFLGGRVWWEAFRSMRVCLKRDCETLAASCFLIFCSLVMKWIFLFHQAPSTFASHHPYQRFKSNKANQSWTGTPKPRAKANLFPL
jgi:hypothetical protein